MKELTKINMKESIDKGGIIKSLRLEYGVGYKTIIKKLKEYNLQTEAQKLVKPDGSFISRDFFRPYNHDDAIKLYLSGWSTKQIGEKYKVSSQAIKQLLKKRNVPRRTSGETRKITISRGLNKGGFQLGMLNPSKLKIHHSGQSKGKRIKYKGFTMRSLYEYFFAKWCDKNKMKWIYEPAIFHLSDGSSYIPDFIVENKYYEIKGWMTDKAQDKINLFKKEVDDIVILRKSDLIKMKILNISEYNKKLKEFKNARQC